jgi:replicative DNA helicase
MIMEQSSNNRLEYRHIEHPTKEALKYIDSRRKGIIKSLKTRWRKFNKACNGGIEPGVIISVGGGSGAGKSSFVNTLETDLFELNPDQEFVVLNFSYEMLGYRSIGRKLSYKTRKTISELYNGDPDKKTITDEDFNSLLKHSETIRQYPIYYVDSPGTVEQMRNTIENFRMTVAKGKWLVIILDHTLLVKGNRGEGERETISNLQKLFMDVKKWGRVSIIQLTQLNRNIETPERISNPSMHYPKRSDVFASDSIFHASDYMMVLHRPETLHIDRYGLSNLPTKDMVYLHILKFNEPFIRYYWDFIEQSVSNNSVNSGELQMDNPEPSSLNGIKVDEKVQRLTDEEPTNKSDKSAELPGIAGKTIKVYFPEGW